MQLFPLIGKDFCSKITFTVKSLQCSFFCYCISEIAHNLIVFFYIKFTQKSATFLNFLLFLRYFSSRKIAKLKKITIVQLIYNIR